MTYLMYVLAALLAFGAALSLGCAVVTYHTSSESFASYVLAGCVQAAVLGFVVAAIHVTNP
jgi:hypothetical protein